MQKHPLGYIIAPKGMCQNHTLFWELFCIDILYDLVCGVKS